MLAPAEHDLLERAQLAGRRVVRDRLALEDRLPRAERRVERLDQVGELVVDPLQPAGEQLDLAVGGAVGLDPDPVVLVLGGALAAQPGQDLVGLGQPLGEHDPHRVARPHLHLLDRRQPAAGQRLGDHAEVAADVVRPLQHRAVGLAAGVHPDQRVEDRRRADAEPQVAGDQAQHVARLQRGGPVEQAGQQVELAALRAGALGRGDLVQRVDHLGDVQAAAARSGQQRLGRLAEVALARAPRR